MGKLRVGVRRSLALVFGTQYRAYAHREVGGWAGWLELPVLGLTVAFVGTDGQEVWSW